MVKKDAMIQMKVQCPGCRCISCISVSLDHIQAFSAPLTFRCYLSVPCQAGVELQSHQWAGQHPGRVQWAVFHRTPWSRSLWSPSESRYFPEVCPLYSRGTEHSPGLLREDGCDWAPLNVEELQLYSNDWTSHCISKGESSQLWEETNFSCLYPQSCSFHHYPRFVTEGEDGNADWPLKIVVLFWLNFLFITTDCYTVINL